jgi:hypothetical protein
MQGLGFIPINLLVLGRTTEPLHADQHGASVQFRNIAAMGNVLRISLGFAVHY